MQPRYVSQTGAGSSNWQVTNWSVTPINIGLAVIVTGTVDYTVQYTYQDPTGTYSSVTPTAFDHAVLAAQTTTLSGSIIFPVAAVRIKVNSGDGTAQLVILQAGIGGP